MGKSGGRNLHTGEMSGEDPMSMFGDPDLRAAQVRRIADFPHAGDLIVNSTVFPDGTVAAMEELIGNHGGIGGEQTDAFIFHPPNLEAPATSNSVDVYHILNGYREAAPETVAIGSDRQEAPAVDAWSFSTLRQGFAFSRGWVGKALRAIVLDASTYRDVASDPYMTGPALLLIALGVLISALATDWIATWQDVAAGGLGAIIMVTLIFATGRILGGKASFTRTLRAVGFAYAVKFVFLLALIPALSGLTEFLVFAISLVAFWVAGVQAHKLRGWRSLTFPIIVLAIFAVSIFVLNVLLGGAAFTIETLLHEVGIVP
jgi:hypothetical protein